MPVAMITTTRPGCPRPPTASMYRRRRAFAGLVASAVLSTLGLAAQSVLTGPGGEPASAAGAGTAPSGVAQVRAEPGDSLWSIAERFHGEVDLNRYVDALIDRNGGTSIVAGQLVHLP